MIFIYCFFFIFSQQDPVDNSTWYWRVILDKYSIFIIIIIIVMNSHGWVMTEYDYIIRNEGWRLELSEV